MKTLHILLLVFALTGLALAQDQKKEADKEGYVSLFDGKSLKGWKSPEMKYWSVEDGAITAQCSEKMPAKENQFLVWQGGKMKNFELVLEFRISGDAGKANSGVQFRSQVEKDGHAVGYQADISMKGLPWMGTLYDEKGRGKIGPRGHDSLVFGKDQIVHVSATPEEKIVEAMKEKDWNEYRIVAVDDYLELWLNGVRTARVLDKDLKDRDLEGLLALQLHSGPPMKVQFRKIWVRELAD